jgi:hypothetical protein
MNSIDLDVNNYKYDELLHLFKIKDFDDKHYFKYAIDEKLQNIKTNYPDDIYNFFNKSKLIILTIFNLIENNVIKSTNEVDKYLHELKGIQSLENYTEMDLYNKIINQNNIQEFKKELLNEKYNDVGGRVNPSLSNKNNTNLVFNTAINEVSPGNLNSVKRIVQYYNLNLNSCFRNNYYQSNPCDFLYMIPSEIKNVVSMRLVSIEIPNSWYLFSKLKKNNIFEITICENETCYCCCFTIEVPEGNYDSETLEEYLNSNYFYNSGVDNCLKYLKFSINHYNHKSKFEVIELCELEKKHITFSIKFVESVSQNIMNTFGWIIGFRAANYVDVTELESEGLFDAGGDRYIYLCINDFQYNNNSSNLVCFDKSTLNEDVIAKIPMINGKLSLIVNDNNSALSKIRLYNGPVNLSRLQIKIIDRFGSVIDLNNMDFSLTLELQILYESFNFQNVTS